ncbi:MAG: LytTR family DNA-binding domain-containing protein [Bacteroidetes bacterium]|nr:LytTR family DNA-binding domain-containing protein [Bacteroidota bacterium]
MKFLIAEDDAPQAEAMAALVQTWFPEAQVRCSVDIEDIRRELATADFDVAILDIMLGANHVFEFIPELNLGQQLLFVTGSDRFMQHAFNCYAVDYILKPYDVTRLEQSLRLALDRRNQGIKTQEGYYSSLSRSVRQRQAECLALPLMEGLELMPIAEIIAVEAERSYCTIHLYNGQKITVSRSLSWAAELLEPEGFYRPHRSWLVNPKHVRAFLKQQGYSLRMANGLLVQVADSAKDRVLQWLKSFSAGV